MSGVRADARSRSKRPQLGSTTKRPWYPFRSAVDAMHVERVTSENLKPIIKEMVNELVHGTKDMALTAAKLEAQLKDIGKLPLEQDGSMSIGGANGTANSKDRSNLTYLQIVNQKKEPHGETKETKSLSPELRGGSDGRAENQTTTEGTLANPR